MGIIVEITDYGTFTSLHTVYHETHINHKFNAVSPDSNIRHISSFPHIFSADRNWEAASVVRLDVPNSIAA